MKRTILTTLLLTSTFIYSASIQGSIGGDGAKCDSDFKPESKKQKEAPKLKAKIASGDSQKDRVEPDSKPSRVVGSPFDEGPFVGFGINPMVSVDAEGEDVSGISYSFVIGAQNLEWRTKAVLEKFVNSDDINEYIKVSLEVDNYILGARSLFVDSIALRPYVGLSVGAMSMDTKSDNVKSATYGGQIGASFSVTKNIKMDINYKYNASSSDKIDHLHGASAVIMYNY